MTPLAYSLSLQARQPLSCQLNAVQQGKIMNRLIYIVGLVVVVIAVLSFFGLR
jgi:hypothetical protein